jgi:hypothetical protein
LVSENATPAAVVAGKTCTPQPPGEKAELTQAMDAGARRPMFFSSRIAMGWVGRAIFERNSGMCTTSLLIVDQLINRGFDQLVSISSLYKL